MGKEYFKPALVPGFELDANMQENGPYKPLRGLSRTRGRGNYCFNLGFCGQGEFAVFETELDSEPLVAAVYCWQNTYIEDAGFRRDKQDLWVIYEQDFSRDHENVQVSGYFNSGSLSDSPVVLSQVVKAMWDSAIAVYALDIEQLNFSLDVKELSEYIKKDLVKDFEILPNTAEYGNCLFFALYDRSEGLSEPELGVEVKVVSHGFRLAEAVEQVKCLFDNYGLKHVSTSKKADDTQTDKYVMAIPAWGPAPLGCLLAALVAFYLPKIDTCLKIVMSPIKLG